MKFLLFLATILLCLSSLGYESLTRVGAQARAEKDNDEVLTPLTDEERSLILREVVLRQPDFVGDVHGFLNERTGAVGWSHRIARKGSRYRKESEFWTFVGEIGKTKARLYAEDKVYDDMLPPGGAWFGGSLLDLNALALQPDVTFTALGAVQIDGHRCIKIEAVQKDKPTRVYLFAATDMKNLVLMIQTIETKRSLVERLHNISFDVPDSFVAIPPDYKPIQHDQWTKVESATIKYGERVPTDFGVFRAPGGELFIWVKDNDFPETYLYRPQQGTVEIEFQGLLVNRLGTYIWRTKEAEAFSLTYYRRPRGPVVDERVEVTPNSIRFRDHRTVVEVRW